MFMILVTGRQSLNYRWVGLRKDENSIKYDHISCCILLILIMVLLFEVIITAFSREFLLLGFI